MHHRNVVRIRAADKGNHDRTIPVGTQRTNGGDLAANNEVTPEEREEIEALRDADGLEMLPKEALVASIKQLAEYLVGPKE